MSNMIPFEFLYEIDYNQDEITCTLVAATATATATVATKAAVHQACSLDSFSQNNAIKLQYRFAVGRCECDNKATVSVIQTRHAF